MITCNLMGGFGNQLFQIFATISYAIKSKQRFAFLSAKTLGTGSTIIRFTFWDTFFANLKSFLVNQLPQLHVIKEEDFHYHELPIYETTNDIMLHGYFQSYKYFEEYYSTIYRFIGIDKMKNLLLKKINLQKSDLKNTISMHFRLGDYKEKQDYHPIMSIKYYCDSLNYIQKIYPNKKFIVFFFCEEEDIFHVKQMIQELRELFSNYSFIYGGKNGDSSLEDWEQMLFMSCCNHNIIANSSFSWWSAYLNDAKNKCVCYPSPWFGPTANIIPKDLCPLGWNKVNMVNYI